MSENKADDKKSKETKQSSTRKQLVKVKKLKNTNQMNDVVGGRSSGGGSIASSVAGSVVT
ncbi:hypothetical protein BH10CYA1_BH10CYA1_04050 [soil metagenome]